MTKILGLSFDYHDSAACLLVDGKVVAASQEERFSRVKHSAAFPELAIRFCLDQAGLKPADIDYVAFYERPLVKLDRIIRAAAPFSAADRSALVQTVGRWLAGGKFEVRQRIEEAGFLPGRVRFVDHHQSHAASAFFSSPFDEAAVITLDGVGEHETATVSLGQGTRLKRLASVRYPHSLGLFYSAFTAFLGFEVNEGEYKVMGMAGFGSPTMADQFKALFTLNPDGGFELDQTYFSFSGDEKRPYSQALVDWLGPPRPYDAPFSPTAEDERSQHYANIAASVQKCTEDVMLHVVSCAMRQTGQNNVCMAGGVALNSVANNRIVRELGCRLYVHPAAGDSGAALGAAQYLYHCELGAPRAEPLYSPYLGIGFDDESAVRAAVRAGMTPQTCAGDEEMIEAAAAELAAGRVIGWFQGRAEWGPRSLGCRSILASPTSPEMQLRVNEKIKFREPFRPFAPSVAAERAGEFFELPPIMPRTSPEYFMISVCTVLPDARARIPAVTHIDGSARVHLVDPDTNPLFYKLIQAFARHTGVPVLLNTSFNLRGEAIVNSPDDALATFSASGLDALVMGRVVVRKGQPG